MPSQCLGMNEAYSTLAKFYDLSINVDYEEWVEYLLGLGLRYQHVPSRILDLGCGTGNLTIPLAKRGYRLTGVDLSGAMIDVAKMKVDSLGENIPFFVRDMRCFDWSGEPFDTVISGCDVLNYLTTEADLLTTFETVHKLLNPGGLWLFDLNSQYKLRQIYGNESYADLQHDFAYFWDNNYDEIEEICTMDLTFFARKPSGHYERTTERHLQKLWMPQKIAEICGRSGFFLRGCYDFLTFTPYTDQSHRWQFVLEKK